MRGSTPGSRRTSPWWVEGCRSSRCGIAAGLTSTSARVRNGCRRCSKGCRAWSVAVHVPVLADEVAFLLRPRGEGWVIDATVVMGGHAEALLMASPASVRLLGLDVDPDALRHAGARLARFGDRVRLAHETFRNLRTTAEAHGVARARAILLDLGVSSHQLEASGRGFSFQQEEPLDMRLDPT